MPPPAPRTPPLHGWTVLSLRPRGQHAALRAAAARRGARTLALSTFAIRACTDPGTRDVLRHALAAGVVVYTSPNAVAAAASLQRLQAARGQVVLAVGSGTRRALRAHGIDARAPARMDSEGLLGMPALAQVAGHRVGLVTGAGGRDLLAPALRSRGASVARADVYQRVPLALTARARGQLGDALADPRRCLLAVSSREALDSLLAQSPPAVRRQLGGIAVVAASARLADAVRASGLRRVAIAADARPASLLRAAVEAFA